MESPRTPIRFQALSLDGGGIRGAFGIGLIAEFERLPGRPIADYFDLVAGSSTGAITGSGVALGRTGPELVEFYQQHGRAIFSSREPFRPPGWIRWCYPLAKRLLEKRTGQAENANSSVTSTS